MSESIHVELPRRGFGEDLRDALGAHGFAAELIDEGDTCALHVRYADDERARLVTDVSAAIETWLGEQMLPLVIDRADGGCVVRPPAD